MATKYVRCDICRKPVSKQSLHIVPRDGSAIDQFFMLIGLMNREDSVCKDCLEEMKNDN